jgi:meiotically up-regulated gene 157 (Mug157) protein
MKRRHFLQQSSLASLSLLASRAAWAQTASFPTVRVPLAERRFSSPAVEALIKTLQANIKDPETAWLFGNCFPNTLDTTVDFEVVGGRPDTYVITGDIDAMWLRDSTAQVWPYLPLMKDDKNLQQLIKGVVNRHTACILLDPYANAFYKDVNKVSEWKDDLTQMKPGIHERKWEVDSLCYAIRLAHGYWQQTGDITAFDGQWLQAMQLIVKTFTDQQRFSGNGPYSFQRTTAWATDGVPLGGYGYPVKPNGLICSTFRPSDDATIYPFLIPSNYFAVVALGQLAALLKAVSAPTAFITNVLQLQAQVQQALKTHAIIQHQQHGQIIAFEINGFGSVNLMDDANVPSLLSLPYLGAISPSDPLYLRTRKLVLSTNNPFFYVGKAGQGIGGPHTGADTIWPMSIILRAITSQNDAEIRSCINVLRSTHAGTGFMHESFHKDDATKFTRKWFAWANTLYGEMIWKVYRERKSLLA